MTTQTSTALVPVADAKASETRQGCCETGQKGGRMKWLMFAAVALLVLGLVTGSAVFGFAAIAPLLYALPCLAMCGMCLFKHGGTAKS
ncbi:hypothetical protein FG91_03597 [Sphingopyxis sp. LC81]|jgi:hypothetical protein|uniref:DUF2933 domain-containing protein n=3 Tax=Sphingomonadaceae TaxID=41297 RepID=K9CLB7_SPHYA|nr:MULTISPECIES: hypothetical protein [Sphingomonadaceae]EKU72673.1 hypothetical protein HMPREF9718_04840 [Sphingobium yanoikuyae ATCC 51230]KGB52320.1 hypothetical protein FG91_03597 [Sphingopyxis sp. LC81]NBB41784.1 hypothetical protein [Sphingobium yanoikuyae]ODP39194.1 hypothetical protein BFL28_11635 [Sphingomonas turrisvirgatae]QNG48324.1 hypothetical protein H3V42_12620 [Sphingobium yanoikuyae]